MIKSSRMPKRVWLGVWVAVVAVLAVACGGGSGGDAATAGGNTAVEAAVPTMPSARFTAVANQVGATTSVLTSTAPLTTATTATVTTPISATTEMTTSASAATAAPASAESNFDLARGERSYVKNECGACHGDQGEGVTDKGGPITAMTLSLSAFDSLLRTGGGLGADHIFGPSAVSPSGMEHLYGYVQSLGQ